MQQHVNVLRERVDRQAVDLPQLYTPFDPDHLPERLALGASDPSELDRVERMEADERVKRSRVMSEPGLVDLMTLATYLGDPLCDAYALLLPTYGMKQLVAMVQQACREGVDAVPDAPAELRAFIEAMEATPDWIDRDLVEVGARTERFSAAFIQPFVLRGAFIATFLNDYAALPMALTGALTGARAARRVNETGAFFACTVLPGGMDRHGPGFEAAAMVRLMHSTVRVSALAPEHRWDADVYGLPIPQVDQMPAGLIGSFLLAVKAVQADRGFTETERAQVEMARYRCFLLGLPEELLPTDPEGIVGVFTGRAATLRAKFSDETCGELIRSTLAADLQRNPTRAQRIAQSFERSFATTFFINAFLRGDPETATQLGVTLSAADKARVAVMTPWVLGRFLTWRTLARVRPLAGFVDRRVVATLHRRLRQYGHAEYTMQMEGRGSA